MCGVEGGRRQNCQEKSGGLGQIFLAYKACKPASISSPPTGRFNMHESVIITANYYSC